jgi:hypothetical protein
MISVRRPTRENIWRENIVMSPRTWLTGFAAVLLANLLCQATASSQTLSPEAQRAHAYRTMTAACGTDTARFCPAENQSTDFPRGQFLCLKIYRADLTMPCRKAVNALVAIPPAGSQHSGYGQLP